MEKLPQPRVGSIVQRVEAVGTIDRDKGDLTVDFVANLLRGVHSGLGRWPVTGEESHPDVPDFACSTAMAVSARRWI